MYGWLDLELARQRREEVLRETHERRRARDAGRMSEAYRGQTFTILKSLRSVLPEAVAGVPTTEKARVPAHGCSAD